jgi:hypothetical protein
MGIAFDLSGRLNALMMNGDGGSKLQVEALQYSHDWEKMFVVRGEDV